MAVTTAFDRVCDALQRAGKNVGPGDRTRPAQCPAHDDSRASLSVTDTGGRVLIHCHAGCSTTDVIHALDLELTDLFDEPRAAANACWSPYGDVIAAYDYVDASGNLLFQVCRTIDKQFPLRRPDRTQKTGWSWKLGDTPRVLYRLPRVLDAVAHDLPVFITEGEKDVHAIEAAGYVATCNPGGAGKWRHEYADTLRGADVVVICDRDKPGRAHGRMVATSLRGVANLVRLVEPVEGKDVSDHLASGHGIDELTLVNDDPADEAPPPPEPPDDEAEQPQSAVDQLRAYVLDAAQVEAIPPPEPLITDLLDLESLAVLYGRPGGGKSFMAIDIALHVAVGAWWHQHEVVAGPVLYVAAEGRRGLGIRQRAWREVNRHYGPIDNIRWLPRAVSLLDVVAAQALIELADEIKPRLVVIDTLARSMVGGDENASKDMSRAIDAADRIKHRTGACVLIVHHSGKDQAQGARGHSSLLGALDTELELKNAGDGILTLSNTKQKESIEQPPMRFVLVPAGDSAAVRPYTGRRGLDDALSQKTIVTLDALRAIALPGGAPMTAWREKASSDGTGRSSFYEHVKTLVERRLVRNIGTDARPLYIPLDQDECA